MMIIIISIWEGGLVQNKCVCVCGGGGPGVKNSLFFLVPIFLYYKPPKMLSNIWFKIKGDVIFDLIFVSKKILWIQSVIGPESKTNKWHFES